MQQYYIKKGKKFIPAGWNCPNLPEGVYFHQKEPNGSRTTSLNWWVGTNPSQPIDMNLLIQVLRLDDSLARYLNKIQEDSPEFQALKADAVGHITEPPKIFNISPHELAVAVLRFVYEELKTAKESVRSEP